METEIKAFLEGLVALDLPNVETKFIITGRRKHESGHREVSILMMISQGVTLPNVEPLLDRIATYEAAGDAFGRKWTLEFIETRHGTDQARAIEVEHIFLRAMVPVTPVTILEQTTLY